MPYTAVITGEGFPAVTDDWLRSASRPVRLAQIDTTVPNVARVWNYLIGGRDNFDADRRAAQQLVAAAPVMADAATASRAFLRRVVRYLAGEAGLRQFLDIGTGIPTAGNTHEVAQEVAPQCRVVYVDSDPMVLAHARALTSSTKSGAVGFVDADVRDPRAIVADAQAVLDFGRPVAVMLPSTLATIEDTEEAAAVVAALTAAVRPGSYIALYHVASDLDPAMPLAVREWNKMCSAQPSTLRSRAEVARLVAGLDLVSPGLVPIAEWRPAPTDPRFEDVVPVHGVVTRKP